MWKTLTVGRHVRRDGSAVYRSCRRRYASVSASPEDGTRSIAIVGAGLAGMTHALMLARQFNANKGGALSYKPRRIVVYEASDRLGGWVHSKRVEVPATVEHPATEAVVELGPRTIRAADALSSWSMMELIATLNLGDQLITVSKDHPSAKNRLVYYDGTTHLMPNDQSSFMMLAKDQGHVMNQLDFWDLAKNTLRNIRSDSRLPTEQQFQHLSKWHDESVQDFLVRTSGTAEQQKMPDLFPLNDYIASAFFHGIYAADLGKLSVRMVAAFPYALRRQLYVDRSSWLPFPFNIRLASVFDLANEEGQEWAKFEAKKQKRDIEEKEAIQDTLGPAISDLFRQTSTMSFKNGIQTLTDAIHKECLELGVEFQTNAKITSIAMEEGGERAIVQTPTGKVAHNRVIAALPSKVLDRIVSTKDEQRLPNLSANPSATVAVVNVAILPEMGARLPQAFGFLVPRASARQRNGNPRGLLGVVYDSIAVPGQDRCTKFTLMFGGPFWKPGFTMHDLIQQKANGKQRALQEALKIASLFLPKGHSLPDLDTHTAALPGTYTDVNVQRDCIPSYAPGHLERMFELHHALQQKDFRPLTVIGSSYTGVSINDCVLYARRAARRVIHEEKRAQHGRSTENVTGLEELVDPQ